MATSLGPLGPQLPAPTGSLVVCLLSNHAWRVRTRWNWATETNRIVCQWCPVCGLTRPFGGYLAEIRRSALGIAGPFSG